MESSYHDLADSESHKSSRPAHPKSALWVFSIIEIVIVVILAFCIEWGPYANFELQEANLSKAVEYNQSLYPLFQHVSVMIFIGIGFLLTYLHNHAMTSISMNFLTAVFVLQVYLIFMGFWGHIFHNVAWNVKITISTNCILFCELAAAVVLITQAGLLGKVSPFQMLGIGLLETFFYAMNEEIMLSLVKISDHGRSIVVHTFTACFGLAVSMVITDNKKLKTARRDASTHSSNVYAMIGTLFLWVFWPSMNSAMLAGNAQQRAQITTIFALVGSTIAAFFFTAFWKDGKFKMEEILKATLAGGVIIGASVDLIQNPAVAIVVGFAGGVITVFGIEVLGEFLEKKTGLHDTLGILALHGLNGIVGGLISAFFAASIPGTVYFGYQTPRDQAGKQLIGTVLCIFIATVSGILTGFFARASWLNPLQKYFSEETFWVDPKSQIADVPANAVVLTVPATLKMKEERKSSQSLGSVKDGPNVEVQVEMKKNI